MEKRDSSFSSYREEIGEKTPIDLELDTRFERSISPADQIRYDENTRFAEVIYSKMISLIDGKISIEELENELSEIKKGLSAGQQKVMEKIYENILINFGKKVCRHGISLKSLYNERPLAPHNIFLNYMESAYEISLSGKISFDDVSVMPWGAVVVKVHDKETWELIKRATNSNDIDGFKMNNFYMSYTDKNRNENEPYSEEKDKRYIQEQANRTIVIYTGEKKEEEVSQIVRHELFHELYDNAISPAHKNRYKNEVMDSTFRMVKNEIVAYAIANRWQTYEKKYFPSSYIKHNVLKEVGQQILLSILKDKLPEEEMNFDPLEKKLEDYKNKFGEPEILKVKDIADNFVIEMANIWREVVRLNIAGSKAFEETVKATLTSQSFNEMSYKLSLIDSDKVIDAVLVANKDGTFNLKEAIEVVTDALHFRVPITRLDELVLLIQKEFDENVSLSDEDREVCKRVISNYEKNIDRWLKPGEQRK